MNLPNGIYAGKITGVDVEMIENDKNRNYGRLQVIFGLEVVEGDRAGETTEAKRIVQPVEVQMPLKGETTEQHNQRQEDYSIFTLKQLANAGVVNTGDFKKMFAQLPHVKGNTVRFSVRDATGYPSVIINRLIEAVQSPEEMSRFNDLPDGSDAPFGD